MTGRPKRESPECEPGKGAQKVPYSKVKPARPSGPAEDLGSKWCETPAVDDEMSREPPRKSAQSNA